MIRLYERGDSSSRYLSFGSVVVYSFLVVVITLQEAASFLGSSQPQHKRVAQQPQQHYKRQCTLLRMTQPKHEDCDSSLNDTNEMKDITILGLGSLLSETSSLGTFPNLKNFRLGRVNGYRRVFAHPASIFFQRGIANMDTKEICSLSAEAIEEETDENSSIGFICSVFEVPNDDDLITTCRNNSNNNNNNNHHLSSSMIIPSQAYLEREEEFEIQLVPYQEEEESRSKTRMGVLCTRSTDETYVNRWGKERFQDYYVRYGINTIWGWEPTSGLKPCAIYLRHCLLAAKKMGPICFNSFLDETYLIDRKTTIRSYMEENPDIWHLEPPPSLVGRYSG